MTTKQVYSQDGTEKRCSKCGTLKPLDSFHRRKLKSGGFGLSSWCKGGGAAAALECANRRYREDPEWRSKKLAADRERGAQRHRGKARVTE
jgi:hypothetical protein